MSPARFVITCSNACMPTSDAILVLFGQQLASQAAIATSFMQSTLSSAKITCGSQKIHLQAVGYVKSSHTFKVFRPEIFLVYFPYVSVYFDCALCTRPLETYKCFPRTLKDLETFKMCQIVISSSCQQIKILIWHRCPRQL
jgi:hypothetical protein